MSKYRIGPDMNLDDEVVLDRRHARVTEARAQEIAEETIQQVRRRRGRPSLSGEQESSPQLAFRIPEQLRARVEARAEQEGRPVSELAREALERYLDA